MVKVVLDRRACEEKEVIGLARETWCQLYGQEKASPNETRSHAVDRMQQSAARRVALGLCRAHATG